MKRITDYFGSQPKRPALNECNSLCDINSVNQHTLTPINTLSLSSATSSVAFNICDSPCSTNVSLFSALDIGHAVGNKNLIPSERFEYLENSWIPPDDFQWPYTERMDGGKPRKKFIGRQHISGQYHVFAYSQMKKGLFCKVCVLFAPNEVGGIKLDRLVKAPLQKFAHLTGRDGYLTNHLSNVFHEDCVRRANEFKLSLQNGNGDIAKQLQCSAAIQCAQKREALKHILQAIEFLGRLGLPLRGHRDSGTINLTASSSNDLDYSQGNFRALLQLMACNDEILRNHLQTSSKNATYISPESQNQLIAAISTVCVRQIVNEVKEAKFFSLLADETTDFSRQEQLSVCLRYVTKDFSVKERFLCFAVAHDVTGSGLANQLLLILSEAGVDKTNMVGQAYDGAASMSGKNNGVQKHIRDVCPSAAYVHCSSHILNLCLAKAATIPSIRSAIAVMHETAVFFCDSNKRLLHLQMCIKFHCPESSYTRLKQHCDTRWVEKQTAALVFKELLPAVLSALQEISESSEWSSDASGKSSMLLRSIDASSFYVSLEVLQTVLEVTKPLSVKLQGVAQDIHRSTESVRDCISVLQEFRNNDIFDRLFCQAEISYGSPILMPRLTGRQIHRTNVPAESPLVYYRRTIFLPFLDTCICQLNERFSEHSAKSYSLSALLPKFCLDRDYSTVAGGVKMYLPFLFAEETAVEVEYMRWQAYWKRQGTVQKPDNILIALKIADELGTYPCITTLLRIFVTLPVTTATSERSFSVLKYIKSYLRSTMSTTRLNGLAHAYIHHDICMNYEDIIDEFSKENRRLQFN